MLNERSLAGHAAVIGAGVMGSGIAAHLANLGWTVSLLDRVSKDAGSNRSKRNYLAQAGLDRAIKARPPEFSVPQRASHVRLGNTTDHLDWLRDADWIVEAAAEDIEIKRTILTEVADKCRDDAVISSNTSGLSLAGMVSHLPPGFRARFLGTHFFNPPRYMKPLELIPAADTDSAIFEGFARFADRILGKRVIRAKDTPGFISTRLGMYALTRTLQLAIERELTVEEVDYLTGALTGRPKSGTFRLADVIGLDITARIIDNLQAALPHDPAYRALEVPEIMRRLIAEGRTGGKSGAGFYRREKSGQILSLDFETFEYRPRIEPEALSTDISSLPLSKRLRAIWDLADRDRLPGFFREAFEDTIGYMAEAAPLVSDRIVEVDDAIMGGFGWDLGPFHQLDALGPIYWDGGEPALVHHLHDSGLLRFYENKDGEHFYFDFGEVERSVVGTEAEERREIALFPVHGRMASLPRAKEVIVLKDLKKAGQILEESESASSIDLGDGILGVEWRSKMNVLDSGLVQFIDRARERAEKDFRAVVLGGSGENFSAGFNLEFFVKKIENRDWAAIDFALNELQQMVLRLKYARIPVVAAVYGYTLGAGCETMLHCAAVQAAFECYVGLPEANVGLIPAGGGTAEMILRGYHALPPGTPLERADPFPFLRPLWENLRLAKISTSAEEARFLGYLQEEDGVTVHPDRLLYDAKERALAAAASFHPPEPKTVLAVGEDGLARFRWEIHLLRRGQQITEHDARIADRLAYMLCGGELVHPVELSEQYLLDLEREAFLALCGISETLARIKHTLATGKPLRN